MIEEAEVLDRQVERYDQRDTGQQPRAEIEAEQAATAGEAESRQGVARQRAEDEIEDRGPLAAISEFTIPGNVCSAARLPTIARVPAGSMNVM